MRWITCLCPHPTQSSVFLSGGNTRGIVCWDTRTSKASTEYYGSFGEIQDMVFLDVFLFIKCQIERRGILSLKC